MAYDSSQGISPWLPFLMMVTGIIVWEIKFFTESYGPSEQFSKNP